MPRLLLHVEGQTEETFVNEVLQDHLVSRGYSSVSARRLGKARQRSERGGVPPWKIALRDIRNHLREDSDCIAGTLVDYYGLPADGEGAWPGRVEASRISGTVEERVEAVERSLAAAVQEAMGGSFNPRRFVPYVMMHEFEAMLFSDCRSFSRAIGEPELCGELQAIRESFDTPEEIDDSRETAPSKRICSLFPEYQKPQMGTLGVLEIGLEKIRAECPHFHRWLERLEERSLPR